MQSREPSGIDASGDQSQASNIARVDLMHELDDPALYSATVRWIAPSSAAPRHLQPILWRCVESLSLDDGVRFCTRSGVKSIVPRTSRANAMTAAGVCQLFLAISSYSARWCATRHLVEQKRSGRAHAWKEAATLRAACLSVTHGAA